MSIFDSNEDTHLLLQQLVKQLQANTHRIEEIAECTVSPPLMSYSKRPISQMYSWNHLRHGINEDVSNNNVDVSNDNIDNGANGNIRNSDSMVHTLKYKPIWPNTFSANKNKDINSWLFSVKQYAELVKIPMQEIV
jgi:hypothetical protein